MPRHQCHCGQHGQLEEDQPETWTLFGCEATPNDQNSRETQEHIEDAAIAGATPDRTASPNEVFFRQRKGRPDLAHAAFLGVTRPRLPRSYAPSRRIRSISAAAMGPTAAAR